MRRVHFKYFVAGMLTSDEGHLKEVTGFASRLPPERLVTINVLQGRATIVWYWASDEEHQALKEDPAEG